MKPRIAAVVLAAGGSTRFGSPKQLAEFDGHSLLLRAVKAVSDAGVDSIVVVLGAEAERVRLAFDAPIAVEFAYNNAWSDGISSSIRKGVSMALDLLPDADGVILMLADQPLVDETAIGKLLAGFVSRASIVAARYDGVVGAPALVGSDHLPSLLASISGDRGAGSWLSSQGSAVSTVDLPDAATDVDTPEILERISSQARSA